MINEANIDDLDTLVNLVFEFGEKASVAKDLTLDREQVTNYLSYWIKDPNSLVLTFPGGLFVGTISPALGFVELLATEVVFYVQPEQRGSTSALRVLKSFETWAKERKVPKVIFHLIGEEVRDDFLLRSGYTLTERSYSKGV